MTDSAPVWLAGLAENPGCKITLTDEEVDALKDAAADCAKTTRVELAAWRKAASDLL